MSKCENCVKRDVCPDFNDASSDEPCDSFYAERPHGEWHSKSVFDDTAVCSECKSDGEWSFDFCSNCGADMREGDEK